MRWRQVFGQSDMGRHIVCGHAFANAWDILNMSRLRAIAGLQRRCGAVHQLDIKFASDLDPSKLDACDRDVKDILRGMLAVIRALPAADPRRRRPGGGGMSLQLLSLTRLSSLTLVVDSGEPVLDFWGLPDGVSVLQRLRVLRLRNCSTQRLTDAITALHSLTQLGLFCDRVGEDGEELLRMRCRRLPPH